MDILIFCLGIIGAIVMLEYRNWRRERLAADIERCQAEQDDVAYQKWLADLDALKERRRSAWEAHNDLLRARTMCDLGLAIHHFQGSYEEWQAIKAAEQLAVELERLALGAGYATQGFAAMKYTTERMKP